MDNWYLIPSVPRVVNIFANAPSVTYRNENNIPESFLSQRYKYLTNNYLKPLRKATPRYIVVLLEKALHRRAN